MNLYYVQYKAASSEITGPLDWENLVAFPMTWEKIQEIFESLREIVGPDHPLRVIDSEAE